MGLRFSDHEGFQRAAMTMAGAGFTTGMLASVLPHPVPPALTGGMLGAAIGVGVVAGRTGWRLAGSVIALAAFGLLVRLDVWAALAAFAGIGAAALTIGEGSRRPLALTLGGVALFAAAWAALRISYADALATWPAWAAAGVGGGALAFAAVLGLVPPRVSWAIDPIDSRVRRLPDGLDAEVRSLCDRSLALWASGQRAITDAASRELLRDGVDKVLEVAHKTARTSGAPTDDGELDERIGELDRRIAAAGDPVAREQYTAARAALDDQKRLRERMRHGRERVVARLHHHVATLERFRLAAENLEATRAQTDADATVDGLVRLSADVASSSEALAELDVAAVPAAPALAAN